MPVALSRGTARLAAAWCLLLAAPALAQTAPRPAAPPPSVGVPNALVSTQLIASMLTAIDHANKTGNYTVLLGLGSRRFQTNNSAASLGAAFSPFRTRRIDLAEVLILSPNYEIAPTLVQPNLVRMRGSFALSHGPVRFDLLFAWDGGWRLDGVLLIPPLAPVPPAPRPTPTR